MRSLSLLALSLVTFTMLACGETPRDEEADGQAQEIVASSEQPQNPAVGSRDRTAVVRAVHDALRPRLRGQASEFLVTWLQSKDGFTYMQAEVRGRGAPIDWDKTEFAREVSAGTFKQVDGSTKVTFTAAAKKNAAGAFEILDVVVAPPSGPAAGAGKGVPLEILPPGVAMTAGTLVCEIHYYDAAALPTPHILSAGTARTPVAELAKTPLVFATPEGISGVVALARPGFVATSLHADAAFLTQAIYPMGPQLTTDLQTPITPLTKDGVTYDRAFLGCGVVP